MVYAPQLSHDVVKDGRTLMKLLEHVEDDSETDLADEDKEFVAETVVRMMTVGTWLHGGPPPSEIDEATRQATDAMMDGDIPVARKIMQHLYQKGEAP